MEWKFERLATRWWFFVFIIILSFFLPHITSVPYNPQNSQDVLIEVLKKGLSDYHWIAPIFHLATIGLIFCLWKFPARMTRFLYIYLGVNFVVIALIDNIANTANYGFTIILSNMVLFLFVAFVCFYAAFRDIRPLSAEPRRLWMLWAIPLVIIVFWGPADSQGQPDFNPILLMTSDFGLAFCFTIPVYIYILSFYYQSINKTLFRSMSVIGLFYGIINLFGPFSISGYPIWMAILHIPLFTISLYGLLLPRILKGNSLKTS